MNDTPKTLMEVTRYYADPQNCINTVALMKWKDGSPVCPNCQAEQGDRNHYWLASQKRWKCYSCYKQFSVKVGTVFEDSPITLDKWLVALWMLTNCKNGVSSYEIASHLGVTQKTAWFMMHRLRLAMKDTDYGSKFGGPDGGAVEVDEAFVGGKLKNMHRSRANAIRQNAPIERMEGYGARLDNKTPVIGIFERESRKVRAKVIPNVRRETLQNEILRNVKYGSNVYTDEAVGYDSLRAKYIHETVNHSDAYVRGQVHTNCLENFWSLMKRNLSGTYVAVEPFHLDRYLDEQMFRFNNRENKSNTERFEKALSQIVGKRLTYKEVTGKVGVRA